MMQCFLSRHTEGRSSIHDIFYQNFHILAAIKMLVYHRKVAHFYLLMRIYLRKSNQNFVQDVISEALFSIYEFVFP